VYTEPNNGAGDAKMTCRNESDQSESSGVKIPSRPSSVDAKICELIGLAAGTFMVLGPLLVFVAGLYLLDGNGLGFMVAGVPGTIMVYYAYK